MEGGDTCPVLFDEFSKSLGAHMWRVNALLVVNAILVAVMVGIGAYGHRYRHRPFTRFLYDGAASLFLPIMSYVASDGSFISVNALVSESEILVADCYAGNHMVEVLVWTGLVQIAAINMSAIVAGDEREGRTIGPPMVLLVQAMWTAYLVVHSIIPIHREDLFLPSTRQMLLPFPIIFAKMILKFYAFYKVRRSFALGHNPRLIVGYMQQLPDESQHSKHAPPPLLVMGEETMQVEKQPHGYCFIRMSDQDGTTTTKSDRLVTIDKVWQLDDMLLETKTRRLQDVCLSFALFKLLRCRFARYTIADAGFHKVYSFFCHALLKDGGGERVLGVIVDELSFLYDYYYTSLPISYPNRWLPILSIFISLFSIGYCLLLAYEELAGWLPRILHSIPMPQGRCTINCIPTHSYADHKQSSAIPYSYGSVCFNLVPVYLLCALVVLTEAKEIASYIFSDWTKVALVSHYVNHASWQQSPILRKWVGCVLRCPCKPLKHWQDKMNQCSILVLHPRKTPIALLRSLIPIPDKNKKVPTPRAVKASVIDALRSYEECRSNGMSSLHRSQQPQIQVNDNLLWTFSNTKGTADIMLVCHIATSILEVRSHPHQPLSDHKIVATHLSRYCVYLVAFSPELLPDDDGWCKSLYKAVKKDAERVLAGGIGLSTPEAEYQKLVDLLSAEPRHDVLKNGARLGKLLAELVEGGEETPWKVLASFWSKMILYVAPSDEINAHAEAIARGGELITLLWALVTHAGIATRPDGTTATTDSNPVPMF